MLNFNFENLTISLKASSWIIKLRWNYFLLLISFWTLMAVLAISDSKPRNRKFLIPVLLILLLVICVMFVNFLYKISVDDTTTVKGPTIIPAGVYADVVHPVAFLTTQIMVFYSGSRSVASLFLSILFVFIASFFKIAVSLDPKNMATPVTVGTSVGLCIVMVCLHRVTMALVPAALTVVVALCLFFVDHSIYKKLEKDGEGPQSSEVEVEVSQ